MSSQLTKAGHAAPAIAFVSPVVVAALLTSFGSSLPKGPTGAQAASEGEAPVPSGTSPAPLSPTEAAALEWLSEWRPHEQLQSPMNHAEAQPLELPPPEEEPSPAPMVLEAPPIEVTSIIASPAGAIATVNGRIVRAGQAISPGWKVREIDAGRRQIIIEGPDGVMLTRSPAR